MQLGGPIEVDDLPEQLRARVRQILTADRLRAMQAPGHPGGADRFQYEVMTPDGTWTFDDGVSDPDLRRVLDDVVAEIIRRRRGDRP